MAENPTIFVYDPSTDDFTREVELRDDEIEWLAAAFKSDMARFQSPEFLAKIAAPKVEEADPFLPGEMEAPDPDPDYDPGTDQENMYDQLRRGG